MPKRIYAKHERDKECIRHNFTQPRRGVAAPKRCAYCGTKEQLEEGE